MKNQGNTYNIPTKIVEKASVRPVLKIPLFRRIDKVRQK